MSKAQRGTLIVVAVMILVTLLFPPFCIVREGTIHNVGYALLFSQPWQRRATVNVSLLLSEWLAILIMGALVVYALRTRA